MCICSFLHGHELIQICVDIWKVWVWTKTMPKLNKYTNKKTWTFNYELPHTVMIWPKWIMKYSVIKQKLFSKESLKKGKKKQRSLQSNSGLIQNSMPLVMNTILININNRTQNPWRIPLINCKLRILQPKNIDQKHVMRSQELSH